VKDFVLVLGVVMLCGVPFVAGLSAIRRRQRRGESRHTYVSRSPRGGRTLGGYPTQNGPQPEDYVPRERLRGK
jgi:hypothetical protein